MRKAPHLSHKVLHYRLVRLKNALNKVDEITREIQIDFDGNVPLRFKRLSKDSSGTPEAKRGLNFGGPGSSSDQGEQCSTLTIVLHQAEGLLPITDQVHLFQAGGKRSRFHEYKFERR